MYIHRHIEYEILDSLKNNPVTAIIGPRQSGKSTLAKEILKGFPAQVYLDLERPSDLQKMSDPELFLQSQRDKLICLDEVQRMPELFPLLRSLSDEWDSNGKFILLGSASRELLRQSSESLAGRISYHKLTPFLYNEIYPDFPLEQYIERGGFPKSFLASTDRASASWRADFIQTFLERDLLQWAGISSTTMRRLWQMLAHVNGQPVNYTSLGNSLGISNVTIRNYIDLLESTFMLDVLPPWHSNQGKRLVKAPRVYVADSGLCMSFLSLSGFEQCLGHPAWGSIWEQVVLSNLKGTFPAGEFYFYRTAAGAEIDIVMRHGNKVVAIECKSSLAPSLSKGNFSAIEDIHPLRTFVVCPITSGWPLKPGIDVVSLPELITALNSLPASNG